MLMLDLCSGLGGASAAMRDLGWKIVTVDIEPSFNPDVVADIREWSWDGKKPDLVWASPPCVEFSRESMPWCRTGKKPDMSLVDGCKRVILESAPTFWIIENVRGAQPYFKEYGLDKPAYRYGPFYLWGVFPPLQPPRYNQKSKESYSSTQRAERAKIPYELSRAVAWSVEIWHEAYDGHKDDWTEKKLLGYVKNKARRELEYLQHR